MNPIRHIRTFGSSVCLAGGLWLVITLILILVAGGEWRHGMSLNNPKKRMAAAAVLLAAWYVARPVAGGRAARERGARIGRVALLGLGLAAAALAGEAALRMLLARRQHDGSLERLARMRLGDDLRMRSFHPLAAIVRISPNTKRVYELRPNLNTVFGHVSLRTNADGLRADRDYPIPKTEGVTRIVGLGDSGMFGWNVGQGEEYLAVLERALNAAGRRCEVLNMAVPGYNTVQELETLKDAGLAFAPDIVIVGWCENDVTPPFFLLRPVSFTRWDHSFLYHLLFHRAAFVHLLTPEVLRRSELDDTLVDPMLLEHAGLAGVTRALCEMKRLSVEKGFKLLLFGTMRADIRARCDELEIDYADLSTLIPADKYPPDYGVQFMHPRAQGHAALAGELESVLRAKGWI